VPKGRVYWCGDACVLEYRMRADWNFIRAQIIERDKVCRCCGGARYSPVGGLARAAEGWTPRAYYYIRGASHWRDCIWGQFNALTLRWEVDHIVSVVDGGTDDPANLRLLCAPCHYDRTRVWTQDRAASRRPQASLALD
jgi:5-methylcytosine-specific restriction endonuclease McrA